MGCNLSRGYLAVTISGDMSQRNLEMNGRPPAIFVADSPALDFLNSVATPVDTPVDWIHNGQGLLSWLGQVELIPSEVLTKLRAQTSTGELDKVADQARRLREWFRTFVMAHKGRPLREADLRELKPLNRLLEQDEVFSQVMSGDPGDERVLKMKMVRRWRTPKSLLLPIVETLARFVSTEDFSNVKACEGPSCTLLFADHTRGKARRWCSMAMCGNRAKQAAHRHRMKRHK
jgi:predicted RNA-binding Zn ribbon-like protein